ncbi:MAG: hypothetical protein ABSB60_18560 [Terracidiphilus sp.]
MKGNAYPYGRGETQKNQRGNLRASALGVEVISDRFVFQQVVQLPTDAKGNVQKQPRFKRQKNLGEPLPARVSSGLSQRDPAGDSGKQVGNQPDEPRRVQPCGKEYHGRWTHLFEAHLKRSCNAGGG